MNLHWVDWAIMAAMFAVISVVAYSTKKYTQSVADFLVANRCAGKYLLAVADGVAGLGAISVVAMFEMYYKAGFSAVWWGTMLLPFFLIIAMTGWIQYRYRQTRVLTMAQFMEIRYSRRFRVFAGLMCFFSGIINFGIFPAVGGRFFQYYCGLPQHWVSVGFTNIDLTYAGIMVALLTVSLAFTFMGGQIAVMVTDFLQGAFCNVAFCILAGYVLFFRFDWDQMLAAFASAPVDASLINPAQSSGTDNFNATYFLVGVFGAFLNFMAWQGNQGYFASAKTPHAARMGRVIGALRPLAQVIAIVILALGAYTLMHHADFTTEAQQVQQVLDTIDNPKLQSQQTVSVAIAHMLPVGLVGIFAAVMLAAFISTHDTYLHSWGSIFVQDVVMPFRQMWRGDNEPMAPKGHLLLLRIAIFGVAIFIFLFSLFFNQKQDVLMFFALTGTVYLGWAGWTIVGGLYWKGGTTAGAWVAAVIGIVLSIGGWYLTYYWANCQSFGAWLAPAAWERAVESMPDLAGEKCPLSAQILYFWSMLTTGIFYVGVSLLTRKGVFNMDRMLHRGEYAVAGDTEHAVPARGLSALKMSGQFSFDDKLLYSGSLLYVLLFFGVFIAITPLFVFFGRDFSDTFWSNLWWGYCIFMLLGGTAITLWLLVGGAIDLKDLFHTLRHVKRDVDDDGTVVGHQSLADLHPGKEEDQPS